MCTASMSGIHRGQKTTSNILEVEFGCPCAIMWVLGTEAGCSARASAYNPLVISLAPMKVFTRISVLCKIWKTPKVQLVSFLFWGLAFSSPYPSLPQPPISVTYIDSLTYMGQIVNLP